jgi:acetyl esterase
MPEHNYSVTSQMEEILKCYDTFGALSTQSLTPSNARQMPEFRDAVLEVMNKHVTKRLLPSALIEPVKQVQHLLIQGPESEILLRIYTPEGTGPLPILTYFHGGGWVLANLNTYDASCRSIANAAECVVVSVAYRQAPEHKYPAACNDAFAAYQWLLKNARSIGGDSTRVAVGGESAGGNLAAVVCLMAKEKGLPQPVHQLLIYPITDFNFDSESYNDFSNAKPLNRELMKWFWNQYLPDELSATDVFASPLRAEDPSGLAPATIITAEVDPLCSDGELYVDHLRTSGVPVFHRRFSEVTHEFFGFSAVLDEAKEAVKDACDQLRVAFENETLTERAREEIANRLTTEHRPRTI